jgi:hypothetical protein
MSFSIIFSLGYGRIIYFLRPTLSSADRATELEFNPVLIAVG